LSDDRGNRQRTTVDVDGRQRQFNAQPEQVRSARAFLIRKHSGSARPGGLLLVLTHLLTTALDDLGRERNDERREQGKSDPVDGTGQF
jgi:hypothetical protein